MLSMLKKVFVVVCLISLVINPALAKKQSSDTWKPAFNPKGAKYKCIISNVSHPTIKGVYAGFVFRDRLWENTNGQIYIDYKPFSMLGGEVEVLNQLQMGAIQGMACSSVASTNMGPRFGIVNLPFLIDSFDKIDKFIANKRLFDHFLNAMDNHGIIAFDITNYGNYGWASTVPIRNIEEAKKVKFRTAESAVNQLSYKTWGFNPVAMPWPDVPVALKQGVIDGLDHTLIVCSITKKFDVCKYFTQINYAQGLFIWLFNKRWFYGLPNDLQETFKKTLKEVCAAARQESKNQELEQIAAAKVSGVQFFSLPDEDMAVLREKSAIVNGQYADQINKLYNGDAYRPANYLKEVQTYIGYKP